MAEKTSELVAARAGTVMAIAKSGGPIQANADEIIAIINGPSHDKMKVDKLDALLRPYIDGAESVAASALTQVEKP